MWKNVSSRLCDDLMVHMDSMRQQLIEMMSRIGVVEQVRRLARESETKQQEQQLPLPKIVLLELMHIYQTLGSSLDDESKRTTALNTSIVSNLCPEYIKKCIRHCGNKTLARRCRRIAQYLEILHGTNKSRRPMYTNACSEFRRHYKHFDKKRTRNLKLDRALKTHLLTVEVDPLDTEDQVIYDESWRQSLTFLDYWMCSDDYDMY